MAFGIRVFGSDASSVTPEDMIGELSTYEASSGLARGTVASIESKLQLALEALGSNDTASACIYLQDVINYTTAQSGKKIPATVANEIISQATDIRTEIG